MSIRKPARNRRILISISVVIVVVLLWLGKIFLDSAYVPVILMYHSVGKEGMTLDGYGAKLNVDSKTFEKQMKFLHDHNYKVITLKEFIKTIKMGKKIPRKTIAITFDDGLKNNFLYAYPALKNHNFPATIFVATNYIGKENFLTWSDIKTMQKDDISIGSHTMSHAWLPSLDEDELRKELVESRKILESQTGRQIETLSYPLGAFDQRIERIAEEAGYLGAVTTNPGRKHPNNDVYALKRIRISMSSRNLFTFWIETSGFYTFIKEIRDED